MTMTVHLPQRGAVLRHAAFARFLTGLTGDLLGDQVWFLALAWVATQTTDAATAGVIVAAGTVPRMLLLLVAGVVVDRFGALHIAQLAQVVRVGAMTTALALALTDLLNVGTLIAVAVVFGIADAARLPAAGALPAALLAPADLPAAQGLISTVGRIATVAAGPVTGLALALGGFAGAVSANLLLFLTSLLIFTSLRDATSPPDAASRDERSGLFAGLSYATANRPLLFLLLTLTVLNVTFVGALNLGIVLLVRHHQWPSATLGLITAAFGAAAAAAALWLSARRSAHRRPVLAALAWTALSATALAAIGHTPTVAATMIAAAIAGLGLGPASALLIGVVQATTAPAYLGRVTSLTSFTSYGLAPVSLSGFGYLTDAAGVPAAFTMAGATGLLIAATGACLPSLRDLRLPHRTEEPTR